MVKFLMIFLIHHIRKIVYLITITWALSVYFFTSVPSLQISKLVQLYALTSITYLYLALLVSPLYTVFPNLPYKPIYTRARRAIGVSAFFFGILHANLAFFGLLGGFEGLSFLNVRYLISIGAGFSALLILSTMAATSFDWAVKKLGARWKIIHRLVYVAGFLIIFHALRLGPHFSDLSKPVGKVSTVALGFLLILELIRLDKFLTSKFTRLPKLAFASLSIVTLLVGSYFYLENSKSGQGSLSLHSQHQQIAQQGDFVRNDKFKVDFSTTNLGVNEETQLSFKVTNPQTSKPTVLFQVVYEKVAHLIILDSQLRDFQHIHPTQIGNEFRIVHSFPKEGRYYLYLDFQPIGERFEQNSRFILDVGRVEPLPANQAVDTNLTKVFGDYKVKLTTPGSLKASEMTRGNQKISFTITDQGTNQPITDLKPYLGSFGHLVMIDQSTYEYLHIHPSVLTPPPPESDGGPTVEFLPIGIYGPFKPGVYRTFAQFNHDGKLFVTDFTVKVN